MLDESNGKFLGDMLPEMENFATWCYKEHVRPKIVALLPVDLESPDVEEAGDKTAKDFLSGSGLEEGWRPQLEELALERARAFVATDAFEGWLTELCASSTS